MSLIKTKATLTKNFHIGPLDVDKMMYWEYELFLDALNNEIAAENEQQKSEMDKYDINKYQKMASNPSRYTPKMSNISVGVPKF